MFRITEDDYDEAIADGQGYCKVCEAMVGEKVDPQETGCECPECGGYVSLIGIDQAVMFEYLEVSDEDHDEIDDVGIISFSNED